MVQVCFIDGRPVPVDLESVSSLAEVRWRVAELLGAPSPENVELLDESGQRLDGVEFIANLGDMKIQTFLFGLPGTEEEECPPSPEWNGGYQADIAKLDEFKQLAGDLDHMEMLEQATRASSESGNSPSRLYPLHEAVDLGDSEQVVQLLADGVDVSMRDADGDSALHRAAYHGRLDLVKMLLGAGADPNALDRKRKSPLRRAYDNRDVAEALLSAGADVNAADKNGNTALHRAAEDDHLDVAKLLLEASGDSNFLSDDDLTPLHTAAIFGKEAMISLLLSARADLHLKGSGGNTALHFAAYAGREAAGKALVEAGADPAALNEDGETPLEHAKTHEEGHEVPAWLLESTLLGPRLD